MESFGDKRANALVFSSVGRENSFVTFVILFGELSVRRHALARRGHNYPGKHETFLAPSGFSGLIKQSRFDLMH